MSLRLCVEMWLFVGKGAAMPIKVDIVALDRKLVDDVVDMVTLPGIEGQMGILQGHAPLLSLLDFGKSFCTRAQTRSMWLCTAVWWKCAPTR